MKFHIVDYIVMVAFLLISLAIGVYYGFFKKQKTTEEYLLGNRQMHLLPVTLSLLVTYQSAISVMGVPVDVYVYNTMAIVVFLAIMITNGIQAFVIVPLVYPLRLTSAYEYLGRRYQSRSVQLLGSLVGMLQTLLYMAVVLFAPALALEAVAGVPLWISVILIGIIGTAYTSVGGIKSVIWTDAFQFVILFGGLIAILIVGSMKINGFGNVFKIAQEGGRIEFASISLDPRVRHTIWSCLIGGLFNWLPNCCNQSAIQRICAMRSEKDAKLAVLLNVPLVLLYGIILMLTGLMLYSYFSVQECDPISAGYINNPNQMMPYFVMHVLSNVPGLAGIFIAALFSGALSSLSSGINALAANTLQDVLINCIQEKSQLTKTLLAKLMVCVYGALTIGLAYLAKGLSGPVTQIALTAMGATGGPVVGIMFLGATFPQANWIGALSGGIIGICLNIWIAVGSVLYGNKAPTSQPISRDGCIPDLSWDSNITLSTGGGTYMYTGSMETSTQNTSTKLLGHSSILNDDHLAIYDISYLYLGLVGFLVAFIVGIIVSLSTGMDRDKPTDSEYIFPCLRHFWRSGYTSVATPSSYRVIKTKQQTSTETDIVIPQIAPIKSLNLTWYNKQSDDML